MALINGFPNFAAAVRPLVADLNTAIVKILEQIGGVDGDGNRYPGNLEAVNHVAAPGFRNAQKTEARSIFALTIAHTGLDADEALPPLPFEARLEGVVLIVEDSTVPTDATLTVVVDDVPTAFALERIVTGAQSVWRAKTPMLLPPGKTIYLNTVAWTAGEPVVYSVAGATFFLSVPHVS